MTMMLYNIFIREPITESTFKIIRQIKSKSQQSPTIILVCIKYDDYLESFRTSIFS